MISINGLSNTPIQDNTIQKENVAKEGKQDKSVIEEKFDYSKYMFRPWYRRAFKMRVSCI